ncbi:30S ribosomal protein S15 [Helicobacter sp. 13S00482-2]|uniref:30S ribosomal protein S15 n=1 Tax=Helicobacter sp. 13S00482-2 TaxID=1476200 RepID=UPI000BA6E24D|nr:30S ribosomal protein S15 [Helicobacter sp. 13S00482-2]PAF53505.1 30S ribosomal protein S15 [Helicobacter sp. 13S00482-2]
MALDTAKKQEIISKFSRDSKDTGSSEVQVALFSKRISELTEHLKVNPKDHSSRLGLLKLVGKRKNLLKYLKKTQYQRYSKLIVELGIKDR